MFQLLTGEKPYTTTLTNVDAQSFTHVTLSYIVEMFQLLTGEKPYTTTLTNFASKRGKPLL